MQVLLFYSILPYSDHLQLAEDYVTVEWIWIWILVFNATFSNISAISWRPVLVPFCIQFYKMVFGSVWCGNVVSVFFVEWVCLFFRFQLYRLLLCRTYSNLNLFYGLRGHSRCCNILPTLEVLRYLLVTNRAALLWTLSVASICLVVSRGPIQSKHTLVVVWLGTCMLALLWILSLCSSSSLESRGYVGSLSYVVYVWSPLEVWTECYTQIFYFCDMI
jgi:hypothetical protein